MSWMPRCPYSYLSWLLLVGLDPLKFLALDRSGKAFETSISISSAAKRVDLSEKVPDLRKSITNMSDSKRSHSEFAEHNDSGMPQNHHVQKSSRP